MLVKYWKKVDDKTVLNVVFDVNLASWLARVPWCPKFRSHDHPPTMSSQKGLEVGRDEFSVVVLLVVVLQARVLQFYYYRPVTRSYITTSQSIACYSILDCGTPSWTTPDFTTTNRSTQSCII
jgi:hypothetical protein